jgi:hypothetical protein
MITTHRKHLEQRCQQRGYNLADVMPCVVSQDGDQWTIDVEHPAYPHKQPGTPDKPPSTTKKIGSWAKAVARWVKAGRPNRTDEEVARLVAICKRCKHYSPKGACRACGCNISNGAWAVTNKARMETEQCPKNKWT